MIIVSALRSSQKGRDSRLPLALFLGAGARHLLKAGALLYRYGHPRSEACTVCVTTTLGDLGGQR